MLDMTKPEIAAAAADLERSIDEMDAKSKLDFFNVMVRLARCYTDSNDKVAVVLYQEDEESMVTYGINATWQEASRLVCGAATMFAQNAADMAEAREHAH